MDTLPVADHEAAEVHPPLEDIGDELLVAVHLDRVAEAVLGPVDARERRHDAPDIMLLDGRHVLPQCLLPEVLTVGDLSLIHISEPTRLGMISYAVFCLKKK